MRVGATLAVRVLCPADAAGTCATVVRASTVTGRAVARRALRLKPGQVRTIRVRVPSSLHVRRLDVSLETRDALQRHARHRWLVTVVRSGLVVLHGRSRPRAS
jgi:hypothetical protein